MREPRFSERPIAATALVFRHIAATALAFAALRLCLSGDTISGGLFFIAAFLARPAEFDD